MSWRGVRTVATLELRQRIRTSRWPVVLGLWFVLIGGVTVLTWLSLNNSRVKAGPSLYDVTTFFVLALGMLIVPSLTATSVNGDREQGVLATLQTTLLTPADIVLGKLLASWTVALVFLGISLPFLVWAWVAGGISVGAVLASLLILALVLGVTCAIGLMFSTLAARPVVSAVLTYLTVAALVFGTVIVFFLSLFLVIQKQEVRYYGVPESYWNTAVTPAPTDSGASPGLSPGPAVPMPLPDQPPDPTRADCRHLTRVEDVPHTERSWWILSLNPFVVVADAVPGRADVREQTSDFTPMRWISMGVRAARAGADTGERQECWFADADPATSTTFSRQSGPVWPYGLAFLLVAGAGATTVAVRRTITPVRRLPNGTRIA